MGMRIYILIIENIDHPDSYDGITHVSAHSTYQKSIDFLAGLCRHFWKTEELIKNETELLSEDNDRCIYEYFDFWDDVKDYHIEEVELDPSYN